MPRGILFAPSGHCRNIFVLAAVYGILVFRVGACYRAFIVPPSPSLMDNLVFVDVKQNDFLPSERADHWTVVECERMVL